MVNEVYQTIEEAIEAGKLINWHDNMFNVYQTDLGKGFMLVSEDEKETAKIPELYTATTPLMLIV